MEVSGERSCFSHSLSYSFKMFLSCIVMVQIELDFMKSRKRYGEQLCVA